jgi:DNA-binding transcriptional MerR regulator
MLLDVLSIGEFSDRRGLSVKVLRTYGEPGLLTPVAVDSLSGYRYYSPEQLPRAVVIAAMRRAGIPLAEIAKFFRQPAPIRWLTIRRPRQPQRA